MRNRLAGAARHTPRARRPRPEKLADETRACAPWMVSRPTEGVVNKIKMLKRQTYGKASFPLLRKRILSRVRLCGSGVL